jgi:hypothetical protein
MSYRSDISKYVKETIRARRGDLGTDIEVPPWSILPG